MSGPAQSAAGDGHGVKIGDLLRESEWIRRLARTLVRDESAAEDLVQETWLAALRRPPTDAGALRPWLAQVLRNAARMRGRSDSNRGNRERVAARTEALPGAAELTARAETQHLLSEAVLALDEPLRVVVLLRYYEGLSAAEIARRTGTPAGTVRWRLKRGLSELRERLDEEHGDRRTWCALLLPLACEPLLLAPLAKAAALASVLCVVAVLGSRWIVGVGPEEGVSAVPALAARAAERPPRETPLSEPAAEAPGSVGAGRRATGTGAPAPEPGPRVLLGAVDASGGAVVGALLTAGSARATADEAGRLRLDSSVARRSLDLTLTAPGFVTRRETVRAPPGESAELGTWTLVAGGSVAGLVLDESAVGISGALVSVEVLPGAWGDLQHQPLEEARYLGTLLERGGAFVPEVRTDASGRYEVVDLPPGFVRIWARAAGRFSDYSEPVPVRGGERASCPELVPPLPQPRETIEGRVLDARGVPVPFALIEAARRSLDAQFFAGELFVFHARCDARGRFELGVDPLSRYTLAARAPAGQGPALGIARDGPHAAAAREVRLVLPAAEVVRAEPAGPELLGLGRPAGLVLAEGEPLAGARVQVLALRADPAAFPRLTRDQEPLQCRWLVSDELAVTDAAGRFWLPPEREGPLTVRIEAPPERADLAPVLVERVGELVGGAAELRIELSRAGELEGVVVVPDGSSPAGLVVGATNGDGTFATRRADASGRFRFEGLAPGGWQVRCLRRDAREAAWEWEALGRGQRARQGARVDARVVAGENTFLELLWMAPEPLVLAGCLSLDGVAPRGWQARLTPLGGGSLRSGPGGTALDVEGCFRIEGELRGRYQLELWNTGYRQVRVNVTDQVDLAVATTPWAVGWATGGVRVSGGEAGDVLVYRWVLDRLVVEMRAEVDEGGRVEFVGVPVGVGELRVVGGAGREWVVEVERGGVSEVLVGG